MTLDEMKTRIEQLEARIAQLEARIARDERAKEEAIMRSFSVLGCMA